MNRQTVIHSKRPTVQISPLTAVLLDILQNSDRSTGSPLTIIQAELEQVTSSAQKGIAETRFQLNDMVRQGLLVDYWSPLSNNKKILYYYITDAGRWARHLGELIFK